MWKSLLLCLCIPVPCLGQHAVLHDVNVVDVRSGRVLAHRDVVLDASRIASIHKAGKKAKGNVLQIGGYVIPGLWDMHVHLAGVIADPAWSADLLFPELLRNGITSVRDMGGDLSVLKRWKHEIEAGQRSGPDLYFSGPMLTTEQAQTPDLRTVRSAEDGTVAVDSLQTDGANFIKFLHIPRAAYFAVAQESKKTQIDFVGHLPYGVTLQEASEAGQKSIEHINWSVLAIDCSDDPAGFRKKLISAFQSDERGAGTKVLNELTEHFDPGKCEAAARVLVKNGTYLDPTLVAEETALHLNQREKEHPLFRKLPEKLQESWTIEKLQQEYPPERMQSLERQWKNDQRIARLMIQAGVSILAGSDSLDVKNYPGTSLHRELELLVEMGMKPGAALRTATFEAAKFLGRDSATGTIEEGKTADLVVLSANPLENISNTRKIVKVFRAGREISR